MDHCLAWTAIIKYGLIGFLPTSGPTHSLAYREQEASQRKSSHKSHVELVNSSVNVDNLVGSSSSNTQHKISCQSARQVSCLTHRESTTLQFRALLVNCSGTIVTIYVCMCALAAIMSLESSCLERLGINDISYVMQRKRACFIEFQRFPILFTSRISTI